MAILTWVSRSRFYTLIHTWQVGTPWLSSFWEREFTLCHQQSILPAAEEIIGLVLKRGAPCLPLLSSPFASHIVSASHLGKALQGGWLVSFFGERRGRLVKTNSPTGPQDWCVLLRSQNGFQLLEAGTLGSGWCCIGEWTAFIKPRPGLPQCHCTIATRLSAIGQYQLWLTTEAAWL